MLARLLISYLLVITVWLDPAQSQHTEDISPCGVPEFLADGWQIESQTVEGMDPSKLCRMIEIPLKKFKANVHSIIVLRSGNLIFEYYGVGPDENWGTSLPAVVHGVGVKHDVRSVTKSVVSLLIGIALDRRLLASIDEPIWKFFPEFSALRHCRERPNSPASPTHHDLGNCLEREQVVLLRS